MIKNAYQLANELLSRFFDVKVLSFSDFLNQFTSFSYLYLDIKESTYQLANELLSVLDQNKTQSVILVADSNLLLLLYIKWNNPEVQTILEGFHSGKEWLYYIIPKKWKPNYYAGSISNTTDQHLRFLNKKQLLSRKIVYGVKQEHLQLVKKWGIRHFVLDYHPSMGTYEQLQNRMTRN